MKNIYLKQNKDEKCVVFFSFMHLLISLVWIHPLIPIFCFHPLIPLRGGLIPAFPQYIFFLDPHPSLPPRGKE